MHGGVQDKKNCVVCGRMLTGKIDSASAADSQRRLTRLTSYNVNLKKKRVGLRLLFCHACKIGKSYVSVSEIIFVVSMLKRVRDKLHYIAS